MTTILGIETSCDETSAAVVADGRRVLSNVVASQIEIHRPYGGVFPEMASRQHIVDIVPVIRDALGKAGLTWDGVDAVAVVNGPGLAGSLLIGVNMAKAMAFGRNLPFVGVNHLEAHVYANWLLAEDSEANGDLDATKERVESDPPSFPLLCLVVSGGHTELVLMEDHGKYNVLGRTIDDAAGEAFDKVGRLLGMAYPGGPAIEKAASEGNPGAYDFPRAWLKGSYDFSFSGLKTAVLREVQSIEEQAKPGGPRSRLVTSVPSRVRRQLSVPDLAASFQEAVVDVLVEKTRRAAEEYGVAEVLLAGGVAANHRLRECLTEKLPTTPRIPPLRWCTDNAAMVAAAGYFRYIAGEPAGWGLDVFPGLGFPE